MQQTLKHVVLLLALVTISYYLKEGNKGCSPFFCDIPTVTGKNGPNQSVFTFKEYKALEVPPFSAANLKIIKEAIFIIKYS